MRDHLKSQTLAMLTVFWLISCAATPLLNTPKNWDESIPLQPPAATREKQRDEWYEHNGVGTIENVGNRYLLSIDCPRIQRVYAKGSQDVQLDKYLRIPVRVRYVYTTVMNPNIRCIRPPCDPMPETIAVIAHVEPLTDAEAIRARAQNPCTP